MVDYFSDITHQDLIKAMIARTTMTLTAFQNNFDVNLVAK
jgi:hypothetical protein